MVYVLHLSFHFFGHSSGSALLSHVVLAEGVSEDVMGLCWVI